MFIWKIDKIFLKFVHDLHKISFFLIWNLYQILIFQENIARRFCGKSLEPFWNFSTIAVDLNSLPFALYRFRPLASNSISWEWTSGAFSQTWNFSDSKNSIIFDWNSFLIETESTCACLCEPCQSLRIFLKSCSSFFAPVSCLSCSMLNRLVISLKHKNAQIIDTLILPITISLTAILKWCNRVWKVINSIYEYLNGLLLKIHVLVTNV